MFKSLFEIVENTVYEEPNIPEVIEEIINQDEIDNTLSIKTNSFTKQEKDFLFELLMLYQKLSSLKLSNSIKPFITEISNTYEINNSEITYHLKHIRNLLVANHPDFKQYKNDLSDWSMSENYDFKNKSLITNILVKLK